MLTIFVYFTLVAIHSTLESSGEWDVVDQGICLHEDGHAVVLAVDVACQSKTVYLQFRCCFPVGLLK